MVPFIKTFFLIKNKLNLFCDITQMALRSKLGAALTSNIENKMYEKVLDNVEEGVEHDQDVKPIEYAK